MVTVVVGGGLTLWLQDAAEPERPGGWEKNQESPAPLLRLDDLPSSCPSIKKGRTVSASFATGPRPDPPGRP